MVKILKTAFIPPGAGHTIHREKLLEKIREHKETKLILLKAGPGFGKTILAAHMLAEVSPAIWISIPRGYFSFFDLLIHLTYALDERLQVKASRELLEVCHLLQIDELITQLVKLMNDQIKGDMYLFLDDLHHLLFLEAEKEKMLEIFLTFLPAHVHVIITSHEDLPFPVSRLSRAGGFFQIDEQQFAFTLNETRELLNKYGFEVTAAELYQIDQISSGWISVIILLINELKGQGKDWSQVFARVQMTAGNYIEHFISNLPEDLQSFLKEISIFEFVDAALCDRYLQRGDSQEQLNRLLALNFLCQMDNGLFGMHQIIRDTLREKLDPAGLPDKYAALAKLALKEKNRKAAIMYLLKAEKYLEAVQQMLEFNADRMRDIMLMQRWLELIPEDYFAKNPLLYFYRGQVLERVTRFPEALADYQLAEELCQGIAEPETQHIITAHIIGLYWHRREFALVIEMCQKLLQEVAGTEYKTRSIVYNLLGTALIEQQDRALGVQYLHKALENCRLSGVRNQEAWILNNLCFWEYFPSGDLAKAVVGYEEALNIFQAEQAVRGKTLIYLNLGNLYLRKGEIKKAKEMFNQTEQINIRLKNYNGMTSLFILQARAEVLDNNLQRAEERLQQIPDLTKLDDFYQTQTYLTYSYLHTAKGDLRAALHWANEAWNVTSFRKNYLALEFLLQIIKLHYLMGEYQPALEQITQVKAEAGKWGYVLYLTEALFFECAIIKQLGQPGASCLKQFVFYVEQKEMYFILGKYSFLTELLIDDLRHIFRAGDSASRYLSGLQNAEGRPQGWKSTGPGLEEASVKIFLFGEFSVRRNTEVITPEDWPNKKALNLLKYLIVNRGQRVQQSQLLQIFWPELEMTRARQSCYVALSTIRKMLEPDLKNPKGSQFLISYGGAYAFATSGLYWLDVEEFTQLCVEIQQLAAGHRESECEEKCWTARNLYKAGLLPENLYDDWCQEQRENFERMYVKMLHTLLPLVQPKDPAKAQELVEELLVIDPYEENANLILLELLAAAGNIKGVLAHFQKLKRLYWTELKMGVPEGICALVKKCTGNENS